VRARRDRQNLMKNKPQLDDEPATDTDMQTEPSAESLDALDNSSTGGKRKNTDVSVAVRNDASHLQTVENSCNSTHMLIVDRGVDCNVDVSLSNLCSSAKITNTCTSSHNRHLTEACNVNSATKMSDTSVKVRHKDPRCHLPSAAVSDQPLPKKSCSQASKEKTENCSRLALSTDFSHHKTGNKQSINKQLATERPKGEDMHDSNSRSNFADNVESTVTHLCDSELTTIQSDECSAVDNSSNAAVRASDSDSSAAKTTAASRSHSVSLSVNRRATRNCVTSGSNADVTKRQTVPADVKTLLPNLVKPQQSKVRFEGNHQLL